MKKLIICAAMFFAVSFQAQTCSELVEYAKSQDSYPERLTPTISTMLAKIEYYRVGNTGLVLAYIKQNDFDFTGKPYIFCGISSERWARFKSATPFKGYGEAFHEYIRDFTCNC